MTENNSLPTEQDKQRFNIREEAKGYISSIEGEVQIRHLIDDHLKYRGWRKRLFWIPIAVSVAAIVVALMAR